MLDSKTVPSLSASIQSISRAPSTIRIADPLWRQVLGKLSFLITIVYMLLAASPAQADFRKALLAYQNRDGATMLKEVSDAVDKKSDEGLMLLLIAIRTESFQSSRKFFYYNDENAKQSTLKTILTDSQREQMYGLLVEATNNSTAAARAIFWAYYFFDDKNTWSRLSSIAYKNKLAKGDNLAPFNMSTMPSTGRDRWRDEWVEVDWLKYEDALLRSAKAGNPQAQLQLAYIYSGFSGCARETKAPTCIQEDKIKAADWLKQAIKNFERKDRYGFDYPNSVCKFYRDIYDYTYVGQPQKDLAREREGRLWCKLEATDSTTNVARNASYQLDEVPEMLQEARAELAKEGMPVFSYYVRDNLTYAIEIYSDGRVMIGFDTYPPLWRDEGKALLMKVQPLTVNSFLSDLEKTGFYNMSLFGKPFDNCNPISCGFRKFEFTVVKDKVFKRVYRNDRDQNVDFLNQNSDINKEIAPIIALVEKYFPTQWLRCEIGNSENYKKACIERESQWKSMGRAGN